jgi:hypothetical protein
MLLEILPDELLLLICSYLTEFDVLQAFNDLNLRLNYTISGYRKHMNLTRVRYGQFSRCCDMLRQSSLGSQVQSLTLSNYQLKIDRMGSVAKEVWPWDQKLPNLNSLTLLNAQAAKIGQFLSKTERLERLTDLTIEFDDFPYYDKHIASEPFHKLTRNLNTLRQLSLIGIFLSLTSISDWDNNTITCLTIHVDRTADLIILMRDFRALQFLSVCIERFEKPEEKW